MYKDFNDMFDGQINAIQEKIKLIAEVCTDKQKTGVVWSLQKISYEIDQLIFGIEIDNVSKPVEPTEEAN